MKSTNLALLSSLLLSGTTFAGNYGSAYGKAQQPPPQAMPQPVGCNCFAAGTQGFSLYAASFSGAETFGNCLGAGMSYSVFPTENVGCELDGTWGFADSTIHTFNASLILRAPITDMCIAPYALIGVGYHTNGVNEGTFHIGAGIDVRLTPDCMGVFADARYTFAEATGNYTVIRAGVRWNF